MRRTFGLVAVGIGLVMGNGGCIVEPPPAPIHGGDAGTDAIGDAGNAIDARADASSDAGLDASSCDLGSPFGTPVALSGAINTSAFDTALWFLPDQLTVFVTSNRDGGGYQIYSGTRPDVGSLFTQLLPVSTLNAVSTGWGVGSPVLTDDGLTVYFTNGTGGSYDVWTAVRPSTSAAFGTPTLVAAPVNVNGGGAGEDIADWVSPDGNRLYIVSDRAGSAARDVYVASRTAGAFGSPVPLAAVNSAGNEQGIILTPDELQAFVMRADGVYYTSRATLGDGFAPPKLLSELAGLQASVSWASNDGCTIFFGADPGGAGGYDIYYATRSK